MLLAARRSPAAEGPPDPSDIPSTPSGYESTVVGTREPPAGASQSTVTRQAIQALPGGDSQPLSYVLGMQPGFVTDTFGFGLHARGADGGLLYVIDGIPITAAPLGQWGATIGFFPTGFVRNVNILTGGFPAEYGVGMGGVIDITTRRAVGGPAGEVQGSYGTYRTRQLSFNYSQEAGRFSVMFGGGVMASDRGFDPPAASPILHDDVLSGGGFARLDWKLGDHDRIHLLAFLNQNRFQVPIDPTLAPLAPGETRTPDAYGNDPPIFVPRDADPVQMERTSFAALSYVHKTVSRSLQIGPYFREAYGNLACDPARALGGLADPGSTCSDVRRHAIHGGVVAKGSWIAAPVHTVKAGATLDLARSDVEYAAHFRDDAAGGPDPARTLTGADTTSVADAGVFVQDEIRLGRWTLLPGLRMDTEIVSFVRTELPTRVLLGPSARLGIARALGDSVAAHGFVGRLWQPPSTVDAPVAARALMPSLAGEPIPLDLQAQKDWSAELGFTARLRRVVFGVTGWGRLSTDQLDRINVGTTNLVASFNFEKGRAAGAEAWCRFRPSRLIDAFGNVGLQMAQGSGIKTERYLFSPEDLADRSWVMLDHVQTWTTNVGLDLHDGAAASHVSVLFKYGSGMRTGAGSTRTVPGHTTFDLTVRHRFDISSHLRPEVAVDVLNIFNDPYAYRIGTAYTGSAWAPLRRVFVRLTIPFS